MKVHCQGEAGWDCLNRPGFRGVKWPDFMGFMAVTKWDLTGFYRILVGFYRILVGFYRILMGFYRILSDFIGFEWEFNGI